MPTLVVPFRGAEGKSRLGSPVATGRAVLARAMLADVVAACSVVGPTYVVAPPGVAVAGATLVPEGRRRGQGAAVETALATATAAGAATPLLVVNADLPCVTPRDLLALAGAAPPGGLAVAPAADGTTNALALAAPGLFAPVYGPGSAARFVALGPSRLLELPNLMDDVDTAADLERLEQRLGPHTRRALASLRAGAAA